MCFQTTFVSYLSHIVLVMKHNCYQVSASLALNAMPEVALLQVLVLPGLVFAVTILSAPALVRWISHKITHTYGTRDMQVG